MTENEKKTDSLQQSQNNLKFSEDSGPRSKINDIDPTEGERGKTKSFPEEIANQIFQSLARKMDFSYPSKVPGNPLEKIIGMLSIFRTFLTNIIIIIFGIVIFYLSFQELNADYVI